MIQRILEHVITAIPAAGPRVLPMAKTLAYKLVDGSCDLQTAKENGRSAIDFLAKLSSVIASEVPQAREELQSLQWKDLPLIPVVKEIHEPSKYATKLSNIQCKHRRPTKSVGYFDHSVGYVFPKSK